MGVLSSMSTAISGVEAHGQMLGVISDNIVNANTIGFKASRGEFQNILAQDMLNNTSSQMGRGVQMNGITGLFSQGSVTRTERGTDLAMSGNGFFVLKGDSQGMSFTRDGAFRFDKDGWLTNLNGQRVQAYTATPLGKITGRLDDVRIPYDTIAARATNNIEVHVNLDARMPISQQLDLTRPDETAQFTTGIQVYDSIGNAHGVSLYFNKTADSTWNWNAMVDGESIAGGNPGEPTLIAQGTMVFDPIGKLLLSEQSTVNTSFSNGAVPDQPIFFNFGDPLEELGSGVKGTTQYGSKNALFRDVQDGWAAGVLTDTAIDADGVITGVYTNGQNRIMGQLAVARFEATERLAKLGENQFRESVASGFPLIGKPNTNGRGTVMPKSLENSNVDLAKEFVDMIKAQRGFQASAKSITTANELLEEVINIKRA